MGADFVLRDCARLPFQNTNNQLLLFGSLCQLGLPEVPLGLPEVLPLCAISGSLAPSQCYLASGRQPRPSSDTDLI